MDQIRRPACGPEYLEFLSPSQTFGLANADANETAIKMASTWLRRTPSIVF